MKQAINEKSNGKKSGKLKESNQWKINKSKNVGNQNESI